MKNVFKATKKPVTIEALKWDGKNSLEVDEFTGSCSGVCSSRGMVISTLEGDMVASVGDYIIKGVSGEFYPCKPDIFIKTYDF